MKKPNRRVIVAMSGGVDSSVAAALLKKERFNVIGVFMKFWAGETEKNRCCTPESEKRARLVAEKLGIPFYVFNFEKEFKKKVVDYFLKEERAGLTPNPCVVCNKEIKFGLLFKKMLSLSADYIATGHYVRLRRGKLLMSKDKNKDQSYFLWKLNQKILKRTLFPIGDYTKTEVRKLAKKFKLPVLDIPESQEICFIQTTINDFLKKYLKLKPGKIIDTQGRILGEHQGLYFYTIGQRKGIGLAGGPYFVLDKDIKKNILIVTQNENDLYKKELIAKNINWISDKGAKLLKVKAKIRYKHNSVPVTIQYLKSKFKIKYLYLSESRFSSEARGSYIYHLKFDQPQRAITPGQSAVFYKGQELLGGGIII